MLVCEADLRLSIAKTAEFRQGSLTGDAISNIENDAIYRSEAEVLLSQAEAQLKRCLEIGLEKPSTVFSILAKCFESKAAIEQSRANDYQDVISLCKERESLLKAYQDECGGESMVTSDNGTRYQDLQRSLDESRSLAFKYCALRIECHDAANALNPERCARDKSEEWRRSEGICCMESQSSQIEYPDRLSGADRSHLRMRAEYSQATEFLPTPANGLKSVD